MGEKLLIDVQPSPAWSAFNKPLSDLPSIPEELIKALQKRFPIRVPDSEASEREIWIEVGKQELLQFLLHHYDLQNENVIKDNVLR